MPRLERIQIFPIKALDPLIVSEARVLPRGALEHDREFAIIDAEKKFVNGKRVQAVHQLRAKFNSDATRVEISASEKSAEFHLENDRAKLQNWLNVYFGFAVSIDQNTAGGFPDDNDAPGPTVISTATLETIASWFPRVSVDSMRRRFRANLEISGVPPFWEDQLYREKFEIVRFKVGEVEIHGVNPCQRCNVPPRDPDTGESIPRFQEIFSARRQATLPKWATESRFNHYYRLAVNTKIPSDQAGNFLRVGDDVSIL